MESTNTTQGRGISSSGRSLIECRTGFDLTQQVKETASHQDVEVTVHVPAQRLPSCLENGVSDVCFPFQNSLEDMVTLNSPGSAG